MSDKHSKEAVTEVETHLPAIKQVDTGYLLKELMSLLKSNMAGDGKYTKDQMNSQAKLTSTVIRVVELELKVNRSFTTMRTN